MIGLLLVTHCDIGREILRAAEMILGPLEAADWLSITTLAESEILIGSIAKKIKDLDQGSGVIILTDMFGGTPCNISIPFMEEDRVEILTGVNLPMVLAIAKKRGSMDIKELVAEALSFAREKIYKVGDLMPRA